MHRRTENKEFLLVIIWQIFFIAYRMQTFAAYKKVYSGSSCFHFARIFFLKVWRYWRKWQCWMTHMVTRRYCWCDVKTRDGVKRQHGCNTPDGERTTIASETVNKRNPLGIQPTRFEETRLCHTTKMYLYLFIFTRLFIGIFCPIWLVYSRPVNVIAATAVYLSVR